MTKQTMSILVLCSLLLSACGNSNVESLKSNDNKDQVQQSQVQVEAGKAKEKEKEIPKEIPISPIPELGQDSVIKFKYHMNSNYDIIPNDAESPKKVVLLTFDDGPKDADMINRMIDTLDKHQAKAIFFVNGYKVKENPDLLKLIHNREQIIGNHSWDHIILKKIPEAEVKQQIEDVQEIVKNITGETPVFFRPPHGAGGDVGKKVAKDNGMLYMTWSNGSLDWEMKSSDSDHTATIIKNITDQLHSGSNILMHELPWTVDSLETLLTQLETRGYSFVDPRSIELKMR